MPPINANRLRQDVVKFGSETVAEKLTEAIELGNSGETGGLGRDDFSVRDLAEAFLGHEAVGNMNPANQSQVSVFESSDAVDSTAFANITGQLVINEVMQGYEAETLFATQLFRNVSTRLNGEKTPGFTGLGADGEGAGATVHEGMPFPNVGFGEDYTETPATIKEGLIVPITKEAVFFDRTGLILERAKKTGESLGLRKENRCLDVLIGYVNPYSWNGTGYSTYLTSGAWVNELQGAAYDLEDWTDIDAAEGLFDAILDPHTGDSIELGATSVIAGRRRQHQVNRILNATEVRYTNGTSETLAKNPLQNYEGLTNRRFARRLVTRFGITAAQANATWLYGNPRKAFKYMENWPITTVQAPVNNEAEFTQDIIARFKSSERGVAAVDDPRYISKIKGYA